MKWHDVVLCDGNAETGQLGFHINVSLPDPHSDQAASDSQRDSVARFYRYDPEGLRECQAHALLAAREYGRLCAELLFKKYPYQVRQMLAPCLAAFVTAEPERLRFVILWSRRNFERGSDSPRVRGTPCFADVEQFASYIEGSMEMNGWTPTTMKAAGFR